MWHENSCILGRWILPNGNYYEGNFANNKPNGSGKWYFKTGNELTGNFKQDVFEDEVVRCISILSSLSRILALSIRTARQ